MKRTKLFSRAARVITGGCALLLGAFACVVEGGDKRAGVDPLNLTVLHTSDIHSRLLPYRYTPNAGDKVLGLDEANAPFGGVARMAYVLKRERERSGRAIHLDSGDCFTGAPIFNAFSGEAEIRSMSALGVDAMVIGNHEFDRGVRNFSDQAEKWATYPLLAANYIFDLSETAPSRLGDIAEPYSIHNIGGLRIAVIGMGNISSLNSLAEGGNSLGITPLDHRLVVKEYVTLLRPLVDLVVVLSHLGIDEDREIIKVVPDIDLVLGGHLHVVLYPPQTVVDPIGRRVPLVHSGAFAKFVGRLDLMVDLDSKLRDADGKDIRVNEDFHQVASGGQPVYQRILDWEYRVIPIDSTLPDDGEMTRLLEPYIVTMNSQLDLVTKFAYAPAPVYRFGRTTEDSPLGNMLADAMRKRRRVEAEISVTNTLGIRQDVQAGPIDLEEMYNVFPFDNSISILYLSGREVREMLDFITARSSERACRAQAQVSGVSFTMNCGTKRAEDIVVGTSPLNDNSSYRVATNDYIARGGSGFKVLRRNTTRVDTDISLRGALIDLIRELPPCEAKFFTNANDYTHYHHLPCMRGDSDGRIQRKFK